MEIAIVGSGLVGRLLAWRLNEHALKQGKVVKITLIDAFDRNHFGTGLVAAAMVAPFTESVFTEATTQALGMQSYQLWEKWLPELAQQTGKKITFNQKGTLVVAHAQDDSDWQRFLMKSKAMFNISCNNSCNNSNKEEMQHLDQNVLSELEPDLAPNFNKGLYYPNEGAIDNLALYPALNDYFEQSTQIKMIENTKIKHLNDNGQISEINNQSFDHVFDCRGNGAKSNLKELRSVRGEVIRVSAPEVKLSRAIRLIHPRFPLYIAPRANHEYIIGATQIESDADTPVTVRSGLELLSALYSLHQGFGEAQIIEMHVGLRPAFIDNQPRTETNNKLTHINGLYRHGYLFAPALIEEMLRRKTEIFQFEDS